MGESRVRFKGREFLKICVNMSHISWETLRLKPKKAGA